MAKRVVGTVVDFDMHNLFPNKSLAESWEDASVGGMDAQPQKTLRDRQYGSSPLLVKPAYNGDFLKKLEVLLHNKSAADPNNLYDYTMPSEMLKHQEEPVPRDQTDDFIEFNKVDTPVGMAPLRDWSDRGWSEDEAPEMSEDKYLRMYKAPKHRLDEEDSKNGPDPDIVLANWMLEASPMPLLLEPQRVRVAKVMEDFLSSQYSTKKGPKKVNPNGVSVRLARAEPAIGRWTFHTSSGNEIYTTSFQFVPEGTVTDTTKLNVRTSCTCNSWLFWGAQFNAFDGDYLYGKITPILAPPNKRDPQRTFSVCKHVVACIPIVSRYKISVNPLEKKRLRKPPKIQVKKVSPDKVRIPGELIHLGKKKHIKDAVSGWSSMSPQARSNFIKGLTVPREVAYMGYKFPEEATRAVAERLKELSKETKNVGLRADAARLARKMERQLATLEKLQGMGGESPEEVPVGGPSPLPTGPSSPTETPQAIQDSGIEQGLDKFAATSDFKCLKVWKSLSDEKKKEFFDDLKDADDVASMMTLCPDSLDMVIQRLKDMNTSEAKEILRYII